MAEFRISERAEQELLEMYVFGRETFGRDQAVKYQLDLDRCFAMIARHPRIGRNADVIRPGLRRHEHESHVILYQEQPDHVLIVAVLHGRSLPNL